MEKKITPVTSPIEARITAPASKSYAQRALAAAMLVPAESGDTLLTGMSLCNDTSAALDVIQRLGAEILSVSSDGSEYRIRGGFLRNTPKELNIGESGLSTRLFTPIAAQSPRPVTLTGHGSILTRPVSAMRRPLEALGATVEMRDDAYLPLTVSGPLKGGTVEVDGSLSSQFITGLLVSLPLSYDYTCLLVNNPRSVPYLDMTLEVVRAFGIQITRTDDHTRFDIPGDQIYQPAVYNIEGDWSGASCLLVAGAIAGRVTIDNLNRDSLQADCAIVGALGQAGASLQWNEDNSSLTVAAPAEGNLRAFGFDATDCPDLFPALAALASFCDGETIIRGTGRLTHKESDRAATIAAEFAKLGVRIDISQPDVMVIEGEANRTLSVTDDRADSHNDHRIAMAVATAALRADRPVEVASAEAVDKSYPAFWDDLQKIAGTAR